MMRHADVFTVKSFSAMVPPGLRPDVHRAGRERRRQVALHPRERYARRDHRLFEQADADAVAELGVAPGLEVRLVDCPVRGGTAAAEPMLVGRYVAVTIASMPPTCVTPSETPRQSPMPASTDGNGMHCWSLLVNVEC